MLKQIFRYPATRLEIASTYRGMVADEDVRKALQFAKEAHEGQTRKYTGDPYIVHPVMVAQILCIAKPDKPQVMAALLHDTVEDTPVTEQDIMSVFGGDVAGLVMDLTEHEWEHPRPNRKTRKMYESNRLSHIAPRSQTIKYADFLANGYDIIEHDPHFAKVYFKEMKASLTGMKKGHAGLAAMAKVMVDTRLKELGHG